MIGAVFGRIVAILSFDIISKLTDLTDINELSAKFALVGAASVLGGVVRMVRALFILLLSKTIKIKLISGFFLYTDIIIDCYFDRDNW